MKTEYTIIRDILLITLLAMILGVTVACAFLFVIGA
jgi:hypothetical protein